MMLELLGFDILQKILFQLNQLECLNLLKCSKEMYYLVIPRLYSVVAVNSNKKFISTTQLEMNKIQIPNKNGDDKGTYVKKVNIGSIYSLNLFLKQLIKNPVYCAYVKVLFFEGRIPDIPEVKLLEDLKLIFPLLEKLVSFKWLNNEYDLDIGLINNFPNFSRLLELEGNFKIDKYDTNFPYNDLKSFSISNFILSEKLININIDKFSNLQKLSLSRYNTTCTALSKLNLVSTGISDLENSNYLMNLFNNPLKDKLYLKELTLKSILINPSDANILISNIDLNNLKSLRIIDCLEVFFNNSLRVHRRSPPNLFFLEVIGPHLTNLNCLELELKNDLNYNNHTFEFIKSLPANISRIHVKFNFNKSESLSSNLTKLLDSVCSHRNLRCLDLSFRIIDMLNNNKSSKLFLDTEILSNLTNLKEMEYLGICVNYSHLEKFFGIAARFKHLKVLKLDIADDCGTTCNKRMNTLIDRDYFDYSNLISRKIDSDRIYTIAKDFFSILDNLCWIQIRLNGQKVFRCFNGVEYDSVDYEGIFEDIVDSTITC